MGEMVEVDSKGRIVIPIHIRNTLGIEKGAKLILEIRHSEIVITRLEPEPAKEDPEKLESFLQSIPKV